MDNPLDHISARETREASDFELSECEGSTHAGDKFRVGGRSRSSRLRRSSTSSTVERERSVSSTCERSGVRREPQPPNRRASATRLADIIACSLLPWPATLPQVVRERSLSMAPGATTGLVTERGAATDAEDSPVITTRTRTQGLSL